MKLDALTCPHCGGELDSVGRDDTICCPYCGAMLHVERSPESIRVQLVKQREGGKTERAKIELESKKLKIQAEKDQTRLSVYLIVGCLLMIMVLPLIGEVLHAVPDMFATASGKITAPLTSQDARGLDANDLKMRFEDAGFENIALIPMKDINWVSGLYLDEGTVDHVTIGGEGDFSDESYYSPNAPIRIYYHSGMG